MMDILMESVRLLIVPLIEIFIIFYLIYKVLFFLRDTRAAYVLAGFITLLILLSITADFFHFKVINWLLDGFWGLLAMAIIVIFQPELRRAFAQLGTFTFQRGKRQREIISDITIAARNMSKRKCGALIVIERQIGLRNIEDDAVRLDIKLCSIILETIFFPNSPLHDGAVIIKDNRIVAARAILPLPRSNSGIPQSLGTRHRAAIAISEETDAIVVTVSEETGIISVCCHGHIIRPLTPEGLEETLEDLFALEKAEEDVIEEELEKFHDDMALDSEDDDL